MHPLSKYERFILAVLEEAGEEHLPALANTLEQRLLGGFPHTTQAISIALINLINLDLVRVARVRDPVHRRLIPLTIDQSISIANGLDSLMERSPVDQRWRWKGDEPIADSILTNSGFAVAREILLAEGWPSQLG